MSELFARIISVIENLLVTPLTFLFPLKWTIIIPGSSAVRFTFGHPGKELKPGIHFATIGQTLHKRHINKNLAVTESMDVLTEDGVPVRTKGVAIYTITSLVKYLTATEDSDEFVIEACEAAIKKAISNVPFNDLVIDSDTVEDVIKNKIAEMCEDLGLQVKRYRFQNIEFTDPIIRTLSSIEPMEPKLTNAAKKMAKSLSITPRDAASILSPNIQFISNIASLQQPEEDVDLDEGDE
jgi:regulator of protease activity HflC (stomatin/prohibitin superfamily)